MKQYESSILNNNNNNNNNIKKIKSNKKGEKPNGVGERA